jgi:hypothetical protein
MFYKVVLNILSEIMLTFRFTILGIEREVEYEETM